MNSSSAAEPSDDKGDYSKKVINKSKQVQFKEKQRDKNIKK
jgi:hypothetical protein